MSIRNNILFILTVFFICTFTRISHAQEHMNFKYLTIENGLSQSTAQLYIKIAEDIYGLERMKA